MDRGFDFYSALEELVEQIPEERATTPRLLKKVKEEFEERKKEHYEAPLIPEGVEAPIGLRWPEWVDRPGSEWWISDQNT